MQKHILLSAVVFLLSVCSPVQAGITGPKQPDSGPGGSDYLCAAVVKSRYGQKADAYWIFEPAQSTPEKAPVVIFCHGWGAVNPKVYGAWIKHIVRKGNIVIYPCYQWGRDYPPERITANVVTAVSRALKRLANEAGHVRPDLGKLAIVGHSTGGMLSANVAALSGKGVLPPIRAVMCVQPGKPKSLHKRADFQLMDLKSIPEGTLLLSVASDIDILVTDVEAKNIFNQSTSVRPQDKDYVLFVSDRHGRPLLLASHYFPCAPDNEFDSGELEVFMGAYLDSLLLGDRSVNALDYFGLWKLFDGLCQAAFYGKNREFALGDTSEQRYMGAWSDGVRVQEPFVTKKPLQ